MRVFKIQPRHVVRLRVASGSDRLHKAPPAQRVPRIPQKTQKPRWIPLLFGPEGAVKSCTAAASGATEDSAHSVLSASLVPSRFQNGQAAPPHKTCLILGPRFSVPVSLATTPVTSPPPGVLLDIQPLESQLTCPPWPTMTAAPRPTPRRISRILNKTTHLSHSTGELLVPSPDSKSRIYSLHLSSVKPVAPARFVRRLFPGLAVGFYQRRPRSASKPLATQGLALFLLWLLNQTPMRLMAKTVDPL